MPLQTPDPQDPSVDELLDAWGPYKSRMAALADRWDLPVVFTELGYQSRRGGDPGRRRERPRASGRRPMPTRPPSRRCTTSTTSTGIWWWDWSAERLVDPGGWSAEDKLAEDVLYEWQGGGRRRRRDVTPAGAGRLMSGSM